MLIMKYITFENTNTCETKTIIVPTHIIDKNIATISPMFSNSGSLFKNVTIIEDTRGTYHRVVGNYKEIINNLEKPAIKIGYK
jgi:hypothetical protein